ncbi:MAG: efflux RND transporter permease subunit [Cyanobium sp. ELA507]
MNLSAAAIRRPIATLLLSLALVLAGLVGYGQLAISDLPNIDFPTLQVSASLPGADSETMASAVALPLEQQFSSLPGLASVTSSSTQSSSQITLQFDLNRDIDAAAQDVQTAISQAQRQLPAGMPTPPSVRKVNPAEQPILYLVLTSSVLPLSEVNRAAEIQIAQRLSMLSGVAQVNIFGAQKYAVRVKIRPQQLAARQLGVNDVVKAVQSGNSTIPAGTLYTPNRTYAIRDNGRLLDAAAFSELVVTYRDGAAIRLADVAEVSDSVANERLASRYNGVRSIVLAVQRQPGSNAVEINERIRAMLPELRQRIPAAISIKVLYDRSETIRAAIDDVQHSLLQSVLLVVGVVVLFLGFSTTALIPGLAIAVSLIATFAVMALLGYSLDNLSLMALTLSVGFVVDDAVVMVETIARLQEEGLDRRTAALKGAEEITPTIVSMTLSLIAVFLPILLMGGLLGRLFREFAITLSVAILFSGLVGLTLTPMLSARFQAAPAAHGVDGANGLSGGPSNAKGKAELLQPAVPQGLLLRWRGLARQAERWLQRLIGGFNARFDQLARFYERSLAEALRHPRPTQTLSLLLVLLSLVCFQLIPKGFIPDADTGQITVSTQAAEGVSFAEMARLHEKLSRKVRANTAVEAVNSTIGQGGPNPSASNGRLFVKLKPRHERRQSAQEVVRSLRRTVNAVPGLRGFAKLPAAVNIGGTSSRAKYQFSLQTPELADLVRLSRTLQASLRDIPGISELNNDLLASNPQLDLRIDRDRAAALGVSVADVQAALAASYGEGQISQILRSDGQYPVLGGVVAADQSSQADLDKLAIRSREGSLVPLSSLTQVAESAGLVAVNHTEQLPSANFSFNLQAGQSLDRVTKEIRRRAEPLLPAGSSLDFQGDAKVFAQSFSGLGWLLLVSVLVIYAVLGILYEDPIHPLTVLTSLPPAAVGGLAMLILCNAELNIYGFIGLILLIGLVKKNGIMMVDVANQARLRGADPTSAIRQACALRFRPIMMTTAAAILGTLPLALGFGAGGDVRQSLGLVVLGGLLVSQLVTLYATPVFFVAAERFAERVGLRGRPTTSPVEAPPLL